MERLLCLAQLAKNEIGVTYSTTTSTTVKSRDAVIDNQDWRRINYLRNVNVYVDTYNLGSCDNWRYSGILIKFLQKLNNFLSLFQE